MKVVLTDIKHVQNKKKCSIFSIDSFPLDKLYVTTGGQDGSVKIWKISETESTEEGTYTGHTGAVLCVRFAPEGDLLASASDDGNVIVWGISKNNGKIEIYRKARLSNHKSDVSSISWSKKYLATGSYDGTVIIYDRNTLNIATRLEKHEKGCKGIQFSPGGGYISTYGDEGDLFLYDKNMKKITSTKKPFKGVQIESFFGRMEWSPDGKYIACGLGFLDRQDAVSLLSSNLTRFYTLVGHSAPVETVAFNPLVWEKNGAVSYVLATGSQDRSIALWDSNSSKPVILLKEIADQPIMDLRWSKDGEMLFGCSYDGTVFYLIVEKGEFGAPIKPVIEESKILPYSKEFVPDRKEENIPRPTDYEKDSKLSEKTEIETAEKIEKIEKNETKIFEEKRKIIPRLIKPLEKPNETGAVYGPRVVIMTEDAQNMESEEDITGKPEGCLKTEIKNEETGKTVRFTVEIKEKKNILIVTRDRKEWFKAVHRIKIVAAHNRILAVAESDKNQKRSKIDTLWIYDMEKCILILPAIPLRNILSLDVKHSRVLSVLKDQFKVIDLVKMETTQDRIDRHSTVVNILLDDTYYLVVLYENGSVHHYNPSMKMWFVVEINYPAAYSDLYTGNEETDCTFEYLEHKIIAGLKHSKWEEVEYSVKKLIEITGRIDPTTGTLNRIDALIEEIAKKDTSIPIEYISSLLIQNAETKKYQEYAYLKSKDLKKRSKKR